MNLPPRTLVLKPLLVKEKAVLALDTGFDADSLEGLRLVKASRGTGWFYHAGATTPWTTRGVLQENKKLVVWGDLDQLPEGLTPDSWPRTGEDGQQFLKSFVLAWTARAALSEPLAAFTSSSVVPYRTSDGWAFAFLPPELRGVLDSLQPLGDRLAWDHFRLPEAAGPASWAFTSAALGCDLIAGTVPWAQEDEAHLRQEIRDLKKTLTEDELPEGPDPETLRLWCDSLTGRSATHAEARWKSWATGNPSWNNGSLDAARDQRRTVAESKRQRRRAGASFWRRRGTLTIALGAAAALILAFTGAVVWGLVKPDPTDIWTTQQVVKGYYTAMADLDSDLLRKITAFDHGKQPELSRDQDEVTNLYVIRQVRTAYEHQSPSVNAQDWESQGKPALTQGQILYGITGLEVSGEGAQWTVRYRKWMSESEENHPPTAVGAAVVDDLGLVKTGKGWKISTLRRQRQPLP